MLETIVDIAKRAGNEILSIYETADFGVEMKTDDSPLTLADLAAHHLIVDALAEKFPNIPVLSEESTALDYEVRRQWQQYFLVDPLDGTKEFIDRNGEFTVNIALIEQQIPVLGVVHVPVTGVTYSGDVHQGVAQKETSSGKSIVAVRSVTEDAGNELMVVGSRRHGSEALDALVTQLRTHFESVKLTSMGSSLKLCLVAEGKADFYPRLAPTCEWDTAAAHAIVLAAGGDVVNEHFEPLRYNAKAELLNPNFFVIGDSQANWRGWLS